MQDLQATAPGGLECFKGRQGHLSVAVVQKVEQSGTLLGEPEWLGLPDCFSLVEAHLNSESVASAIPFCHFCPLPDYPQLTPCNILPPKVLERQSPAWRSKPSPSWALKSRRTARIALKEFGGCLGLWPVSLGDSNRSDAQKQN